MKQLYHCAWCGAEVYRYACEVGKRVFCSPTCRSAFLSKKTNPDGYIKHPHLADYNKAHNAERMTDEVRLKLRSRKLASRRPDVYAKFLGRHVHRIVAELKLGRQLRPGEIVHHIDGDKQNNSPSNLQILPSQADHARLHGRKKVMPNEVHTA